MTSFSKDVTDPVKKAFEAADPGVTLEVQNRNTNAGVKYLEETKANNQVDLFWASAPDAFEVLKGKSLLQKYTPKATGIPEKIGQFPINDPAGLLFRLCRVRLRHHVERALREGQQAARAEGVAGSRQGGLFRPCLDRGALALRHHASDRSRRSCRAKAGTRAGRTIKAMAGNFRNVTERSFGVPEAVNSGQVGYGIVIDFFAFSAQASGFPVKFVYPTVTTIVPANVGIVANAPNKAGAEAFVEYLLSPAGQEVLFEPGIRRLPVNPDVYAKAPADYPESVQGPAARARWSSSTSP